MKAIVDGLLRVIAVLVFSVGGFVIGGIAGYKFCMWWVVPVWVKAYPHDGQLGLGVMMYAAGGAVIGAIVFWDYRNFRRNQIWP